MDVDGDVLLSAVGNGDLGLGPGPSHPHQAPGHLHPIRVNAQGQRHFPGGDGENGREAARPVHGVRPGHEASHVEIGRT